MLHVRVIRDFPEFRFQLKKMLCESKNPKEIVVFSIFNLNSGKVRKVEIEIEIKSLSGFLLGLELGIGHWDNHKLLGFAFKEENKGFLELDS